MPTQRTIAMPDGTWAEDAQTSIPIPPVPGQAYRNPNVDLPRWREGWQFERIIDGSQWNQLLYLLTAMIRQIEQMGVPVWSPGTNYIVDSIAMGTNGTLYQAIAASGPGYGGAQPPPNAAYWKNAVVPAPVTPPVLLINDEIPAPTDLLIGLLNADNPLPPAGRENVQWQRNGLQISASVPEVPGEAGAAASNADGSPAGIVTLSADNAPTTERGKAATPATIAFQLNAKITYGTDGMTPGTTALANGVVYLQFEM